MIDKTTDNQASRIAGILAQYAPAGWRRLILKFENDARLMRITTVAETAEEAEHRFLLDNQDATIIEGIFTSLIDIEEPSAITFSVDFEGNYSFVKN